MKCFFITVLLFYTYLSFSQNIIIDNDSGERISYVNIAVKSTDYGFYANKKGEFIIKNQIKTGDTLVFSALGFDSKEIVFNKTNQLKKISLTKKIESLNEIVISNNPTNYKIKNLGITKKRKNIFRVASITQMVVFIKNDSLMNEEGFIKELVYKHLKTNYKSGINVHENNNKCPTIKDIKISNDVAVKLQLYPVNENSKLPDLENPLINKSIIVKLGKNKKVLRHDISSYDVVMPKEGVFISLEILGFFNENGEIIYKNLGQSGFVRYKRDCKSKCVTYSYTKSYKKEWIKDIDDCNAVFSIKVEYPIN